MPDTLPIQQVIYIGHRHSYSLSEKMNDIEGRDKNVFIANRIRLVIDKLTLTDKFFVSNSLITFELGEIKYRAEKDFMFFYNEYFITLSGSKIPVSKRFFREMKDYIERKIVSLNCKTY